MSMRDWIGKLDEFLKISGRELLAHAGRVSAETAKAKAELEYAKYRVALDVAPRAVDAEFEKAAKALVKMPRSPQSRGIATRRPGARTRKRK